MVRRPLERLAGGFFAALDDVRLALGLLGSRGWLVAAGAGLAMLLTVGLTMGIIDSRFFIRMTPVRPQDYAIWLASGLLVGLITGTFVGPAPAGDGRKTVWGGVLSVLAVGCPICNKLVVLLLGVSGALTVFGPAQLYLGALSIALLAWTFRLRAQAIVRACSVPGLRPGRTRKPGRPPPAVERSACASRRDPEPADVADGPHTRRRRLTRGSTTWAVWAEDVANPILLLPG